MYIVQMAASCLCMQEIAQLSVCYRLDGRRIVTATGAVPQHHGAPPSHQLQLLSSPSETAGGAIPAAEERMCTEAVPGGGGGQPGDAQKGEKIKHFICEFRPSKNCGRNSLSFLFCGGVTLGALNVTLGRLTVGSPESKILERLCMSI